jgi:hypothetical protein
MFQEEVLVFTRKVRPPAEFNASTKSWSYLLKSVEITIWKLQ